MEKNPAVPEKYSSFPRHSNKKNLYTGPPSFPRSRYDTIAEEEEAPADNHHESSQEQDEGTHDHQQDEQPATEMSLPQALEQVDRFLEALSQIQEKGDLPELPSSVELLSKTVESRIAKYGGKRLGQDAEEDSTFFEAVDRIGKLSIMLGSFPSNSTMSLVLNRTSSVLQRAMALLDDEFRNLLNLDRDPNATPFKDNYNSDQTMSQKITSKLSSFNNSSNNNLDQLLPSESDNNNYDNFPSFSAEIISTMHKITSTMIAAGYDNECCIMYSISRRNAFKAALTDLGYDNISIDDVQRMQWESLEGEIAAWIGVVKICSSVLFSGERKLCDAVFADHESLANSLFCNLARAVVIQLFNFADAVVLTKRSAEKLFKILDMYETLRDQIPAMKSSYPEEVGRELISEAEAAKSRLGEAAVSIFCDLENSIKSDNGRIPVPSGAVHPLTRYVMNYLKYACEYKDALEQVFQEYEKTHGNSGTTTSAFQTQLNTVMDMLDSNLDMKSKLYRDPSLRHIFLMNNGRYIMQKVKGSAEIHQLMGDRWRRKRSTDLRQYHKNYQRETWSKVLQLLNHEGLAVNGKVSKQLLKDRFKTFNATFEDIHKTQSTWVVSDEQLQSELRVSVSAVIIPAYRGFWGRFKQYLDSGRNPEKYIKYQPEDIENLIDDLFDGNPTSMFRRR